MKPQEQVDELGIPADLFKSRIISKINSHDIGTWDNLLDLPPYVQWENIKLVDDRLFIEKSAKPLDKFSRYTGVAGAIECEIVPSGDTTIIKAKIELDTAMVEVMKYLMGVIVGISGVITLIIYFDFRILLGLLAVEGFLFWVLPLFQERALDDLRSYYRDVINDVLRN
jgi:hypothetical protein